TVDGVSQPTDIRIGTLGMVGPFLDWYVKPDKGFHLMWALCGARITLEDQSGNVKSNAPIGGGGGFGIGYERSLGGKPALGIMARLAGAALTDSIIVRHNVYGASLLGTFTFN